jgi:RNA recognition motif-containing protein
MSFYIKGSAASAHKSKLTNQLFVRVNGAQSEKLLLPPLQVLRGFFNEYGKVVKIISVKEGTIAFITFASPTEALAAKEALNGHEIINNSKGANKVCSLFVDFAREKTKELPRQFVAAPIPVEEAPRPVEVKPSLPILDCLSADLPMVYLFPDQRPKMMSNQAMGLLFDLGLSPKLKYQGDTDVQIFGNGIQWVIPHPDHPYATQDCERAYDSGTYFTQFPVKIPRDVLTSKKFWRD